MMNDWLHERMIDLFGDVKILKEGQAARYRAVKGPRGSRIKVLQDGEIYAVDCPYCTDTRKRLVVSYTYGTSIKHGGETLRFPRLAHCFNETHCMSNPAKRSDLWERLTRRRPPLLPLRTRPGKKPKAKKAIFPEHPMELTALPEEHHAVQYVLNREFDPEFLTWLGVRYCRDDPNPMVNDRLFFPLFDRTGKLVGGQCRMLIDSHGKWPPKYYTLDGSPRGSSLLNMEHVNTRQMVLVTEGPFDALRIPDYSVATMGANLCSGQIDLLSEWEIVLFAYDPDLKVKDEVAYRNYRRAISRMSANSRVFELNLPPGEDPASLGEERLWQLIHEALQSLLSA